MVQVKSQSMLHHGSVGVILKQNKRNLTLTLNVLLHSIIFHSNLCLFCKFANLSFSHLLAADLLYEEVMSVSLYGTVPLTIWHQLFFECGLVNT